MSICPELSVYDFKELEQEPMAISAAILTNLPSSDELELYQKLFPKKSHKKQIKKIQRPLNALLFNFQQYVQSEEDPSSSESEEEAAYDAEDEAEGSWSVISSVASGNTRSEWDFVNEDLPGDAPDSISLDGSVLEYSDGLLHFKNCC